MTQNHWAPNEPGRERGVASRAQKMRGIRSTQLANMQRFVYYRARRIVAGELARACEKFGGGRREIQSTRDSSPLNLK